MIVGTGFPLVRHSASDGHYVGSITVRHGRFHHSHHSQSRLSRLGRHLRHSPGGLQVPVGFLRVDLVHLVELRRCHNAQSEEITGKPVGALGQVVADAHPPLGERLGLQLLVRGQSMKIALGANYLFGNVFYAINLFLATLLDHLARGAPEVLCDVRGRVSAK